jgi:hypothetical protein
MIHLGTVKDVRLRVGALCFGKLFFRPENMNAVELIVVLIIAFIVVQKEIKEKG